MKYQGSTKVRQLTCYFVYNDNDDMKNQTFLPLWAVSSVFCNIDKKLIFPQ